MFATQVRRTGAGDPVIVLSNGIAVEDWHPECPGPQERRPHRSVAVMTSLRQAERKRPLQVVYALAQAIRSILGADAIFKIYGDGPLRERPTREVTKSGLADHIELMGRVEHTRLTRALVRADIYLQTSPAKFFDISTLEACSAGLVVVAICSSGMRNFIIDNVGGLLADDDADLGHELATLLGGDELLKRIKTHSHEVAPLTEWGAVAQMNAGVYRRVIILVGA